MEEIVHFFDKFAQDFSTFSGEIIASKYQTPYVAISASGEITLMNSEEKIISYFRGHLDEYKKQGVVFCSYDNLETAQIGECAFTAIVTWTLNAKDERVILSWRESYNLLVSNKGIHIYSSADFLK